MIWQVRISFQVITVNTIIYTPPPTGQTCIPHAFVMEKVCNEILMRQHGKPKKFKTDTYKYMHAQVCNRYFIQLVNLFVIVLQSVGQDLVR